MEPAEQLWGTSRERGQQNGVRGATLFDASAVAAAGLAIDEARLSGDDSVDAAVRQLIHEVGGAETLHVLDRLDEIATHLDGLQHQFVAAAADPRSASASAVLRTSRAGFWRWWSRLLRI